MISVLYIHSTGAFGGSSRSLLELINGFPQGTVDPHILTAKGNVCDVMKENGIKTIQAKGLSIFDNTKYGRYKGIRWLLMVREMYFLPFTFISILKARKKWEDIEIIHINEITYIFSILICKLIFNKPIIVHARSVQDRTDNIRKHIINYILNKLAKSVIAIDTNVKDSLSIDIPIKVIYNSFSVSERKFYVVNDQVDHLKRKLNLLMVGNLLLLKGVDIYLQAAKVCKEKSLDISFFLVGSNVRKLNGVKKYILEKLNLSHDMEKFCKNYIDENNLHDSVFLLGYRNDILGIYKNIDVVCFPSYLNAIGRPTIEAALLKKPSIVAVENPDENLLINGHSGFCFEPGNVKKFIECIEYYYNNSNEITRTGQNAYKNAVKKFNPSQNSEQVLELYTKYLPNV